MMVTTLIHVSLWKSRQVTTRDALPRIKFKCNMSLQMHTAMLTSTSESKPCCMEVPLSGIGTTELWLQACMHLSRNLQTQDSLMSIGWSESEQDCCCVLLQLLCMASMFNVETSMIVPLTCYGLQGCQETPSSCCNLPQVSIDACSNGCQPNTAVTTNHKCRCGDALEWLCKLYNASWAMQQARGSQGGQRVVHLGIRHKVETLQTSCNHCHALVCIHALL